MNSPASQLFCFSPRTWQFLPLHQHLQQSTTKGIMKCGHGHHFDTGKNLSLSRLFPTTIYPTQWILLNLWWPVCTHTFKEGTSYQFKNRQVWYIGCIALCEHSLKMAAKTKCYWSIGSLSGGWTVLCDTMVMFSTHKILQSTSITCPCAEKALTSNFLN